MKRLKSLRNISIFAATAAASLTVGIASAARPADISDTKWVLQTNRALAQLVITTQFEPDAPGSAICRIIEGTIDNDTAVSGWYFSSTGRIHFVHKNQYSDTAVWVFFGNVAVDALG
jgi:hypothetical protein